MGDTRKSGEFAIVTEIAEQIYTRFDKRVEDIVSKFEDHAKDVSAQLATGDKTMALINASVQGVKEDVKGLTAKVETNAGVVQKMQLDAQNFRKRGDTTPQATRALEPKVEPKPSAWSKTGDYALQAAVTALTVALMVWLLRGGMAPVVNSAAPPAAPTTPTAATPTGQ